KPPTSAPMEVPQTTSGSMPCSPRARSTPRWAQPRAAPPPRAMPRRGEVCCGSAIASRSGGQPVRLEGVRRRQPGDLEDLLLVERPALEQRRGEASERVAVLGQQAGYVLAPAEDGLDVPLGDLLLGDRVRHRGRVGPVREAVGAPVAPCRFRSRCRHGRGGCSSGCPRRYGAGGGVAARTLGPRGA